MYILNTTKQELFVKIRLVLIYTLPIFTFYRSWQMPISIVVFCLIATLMNSEEFLYCIPIQIFFYLQLIVGSVAVFRLYTLLYIISIIWKRYIDISIYKRNILYVIIGIFFSLFVIAPRELQRGIFLCLDIIILWSSTSELRAKNKINEELKYFVYAALCAGLYGMFSGAAYITEEVLGGYYTTMPRYLATFNDVNYAGMFFNIAIICCISLKNVFKNRVVKCAVLMALYVALLATLSITAIICNAVLLILYFLLERKKNLIRIIAIIIIGIIIVYFLYIYGLNNVDSTIGHFVYRISDRIMALKTGDYSAFTSYRVNKTNAHWDFFWNQGILKMLLGGNPISAAYTDSSVFTYAAHNEYVDLLLSVGIIGWILYFGTYIARFIKDLFFLLKEECKEKVDQEKTVVLVHACYLIYAATLTMFLDHRFLFVFLL